MSRSWQKKIHYWRPGNKLWSRRLAELINIRAVSASAASNPQLPTHRKKKRKNTNNTSFPITLITLRARIGHLRRPVARTSGLTTTPTKNHVESEKPQECLCGIIRPASQTFTPSVRRWEGARARQGWESILRFQTSRESTLKLFNSSPKDIKVSPSVCRLLTITAFLKTENHGNHSVESFLVKRLRGTDFSNGGNMLCWDRFLEPSLLFQGYDSYRISLIDPQQLKPNTESTPKVPESVRPSTRARYRVWAQTHTLYFKGLLRDKKSMLLKKKKKHVNYSFSMYVSSLSEQSRNLNNSPLPVCHLKTLQRTFYPIGSHLKLIGSQMQLGSLCKHLVYYVYVLARNE